LYLSAQFLSAQFSYAGQHKLADESDKKSRRWTLKRESETNNSSFTEYD